MYNKGAKYNLNEQTLILRKAKSDCEARLTEAIKNNNKEELIELTSVYYDILIAMDVQRKLAYQNKKNKALENYHLNKNLKKVEK